MKIDKILVPVDFSSSADRAVDHAIELARKFDAEIHLLHSYQLSPGAILPYETALPATIYDDLRKVATQELTKVHDRVKAAGPSCVMHLSQDIPANAIVQAADELDADLIVMGTRGLTGLKHAFLGSVAERTVRLARCPVLTVNEHKDD